MFTPVQQLLLYPELIYSSDLSDAFIVDIATYIACGSTYFTKEQLAVLEIDNCPRCDVSQHIIHEYEESIQSMLGFEIDIGTSELLLLIEMYFTYHNVEVLEKWRLLIDSLPSCKCNNSVHFG
jgi:hypothetical protein